MIQTQEAKSCKSLGEHMDLGGEGGGARAFLTAFTVEFHELLPEMRPESACKAAICKSLGEDTYMDDKGGARASLQHSLQVTCRAHRPGRRGRRTCVLSKPGTLLLRNPDPE